jgi:hypothetical protein
MIVRDASALTVAERRALIEADQLTVDAGCELLDADGNLIEDISDDLVAEGSSVARSMYRTIHGSCRLNLSKELQWGSQRLRPYLLLSTTGDVFYRWNLGVFLPSTPERVIGATPAVWSVDGFDKLDILNTPLAASTTVAAGDNILDAVTALLNDAGETRVAFDPTAATEVAASARVYSLVGDWTLLTVCNDLLSSVGYEALWVDRDGVYRSAPYTAPTDRSTVWEYNADNDTTTVGLDRTSTQDYYRAANVIVAISDSPNGDIPTDGDGIYTLTNEADGLTSIGARGGRQIVRHLRGNYETQAALIVAANTAMNAEKRVANYVSLNVSPNPVHGHFDVVRFTDSAFPVDGRFLVTDWELPLNGADMTLALRGV